MAKSPARFIREVKQEGSKVTWPSKKETWVASIMVLIVVIFLSVFFFVTDFFAAKAIKLILGI
ncbi:MAG: preprotein translocase subunit SecE [Alphaproteobacteria bacterium CG11_big_fil_rev_8_21_14_0_20_44_7]|nr:MAG: preprotein translocase subunit SecE [Alphaproteobacteria bacterium CG11_big_fil_rev_8_21_14_0_20_44_7]